MLLAPDVRTLDASGRSFHLFNSYELNSHVPHLSPRKLYPPRTFLPQYRSMRRDAAHSSHDTTLSSLRSVLTAAGRAFPALLLLAPTFSTDPQIFECCKIN